MSTQWVAFASILLANATAAVIVAAFLSRRPAFNGLKYLVWTLLMLAMWSFCYAMITLSSDIEVKRNWLRFENIGILSMPVFWFLFTLQYTRFDKWLTPYTRIAFFLVPLISMAFLFSDGWFHYYYASITPVSPNGGPLIIKRGEWYPVNLIYIYVLNLLTIITLIWRAVQHQTIYRRQLLFLVGAALIPIIVNILYQTALSFYPNSNLQIDLTPISFTVTLMFLSLGVFGLRIFEVIPIARHTVLEHIPEMVFVVDAKDVVIDANPAAQEALGKPLDDIIGKDSLEVFRAWPQFLNKFLTMNSGWSEIQISGDPPLTFEITISILYDQFHQVEGRVIMAHDITDRKWLENDMKYANDALRAQLEEIEKLRADLQEQATRDPLTNLYNRRYLSDFLDREAARAEREQSPFSVMILDADNFKQFNDQYSYACGDLVLQSITKFLLEHTRRGDLVCRYGGEEFVVVMPGAPQEFAFERGETLRKEFSELAILYEGKQLFATFSAGVASFPIHGKTHEAVLQAADRALHHSKNTGKNKVTLYQAHS